MSMKKKLTTLLSIFLLAFIMFSTSATPALAAMQCESKTEIFYYDPIADENERFAKSLMTCLSIFGTFGATETVGRVIGGFSCALDAIGITLPTPNKKPVKYKVVITKCIDYDILKKEPFSASIGYVKAIVINLDTGKSAEWYHHNIGYNPILK